MSKAEVGVGSALHLVGAALLSLWTCMQVRHNCRLSLACTNHMHHKRDDDITFLLKQGGLALWMSLRRRRWHRTSPPALQSAEVHLNGSHIRVRYTYATLASRISRSDTALLT